MDINLKRRGKKVTRKFSRLSKKAVKTSATHLKSNFFNRISNIQNVRLLIFEWILLVSAIFLLAITQSFWHHSSYSDQFFTSGGTYIEATLGKVSSLNPLLAKTESEKALARLLFSSLVTIDSSGHTGPDLAKSITHDQTAKVWTITLRDGLKWSDHTPLTTEDVLFTIQLIQNNLIDNPYANQLAQIKTKTTHNQIIFTLPSPYADFSSALLFPILPAHILKNVSKSALSEHPFNSNPITSGPFSYRASQQLSATGDTIFHLTANPLYHRTRPLLDSFSIFAATDKGSIINALKDGSVTATAAFTPTEIPKNLPPIIYEKRTTINSGAFLFLNILRLSKTFRQDLRTALDFRSLRAPLIGETPLDLPFIDSTQNFKSLTPKYDPESTKEKLSLDHTIEIISVNSGYLPALAENLKFQLDNLGLKTTLTIHEPTQEFIKNILHTRSYDILVYEIDLGPTLDVFPYYHSSQISDSGLNLSNYSNPLVDDLLLAARSNPDPSFRLAKYATFLKSWFEDVPSIPIYQTNLSYLFNHHVRTFSEDNRLSSPLDRFFDVNLWSSIKTTKHRTP